MTYNYYQIENLINNKIYIGITEFTIEERFKRHKKLLEKNQHPNYYLQPDWNKYGAKNFQISLIESKEYEDIEEAYEYEFFLIQSSSKELYNIQPGGIVNPIKNKISYDKMVTTKQNQVPDIYCLEEISENVFKIIDVFSSQKEAGRAKPEWNQGTINTAIKKHIKGHGYYWVQQQDIENQLKNWKPTRLKFKPTALIDSNGNILEVHHNARVFEKINNYRAGAVSGSICHGTSCHKKLYKYITEVEYYQLMPITLVK